MCGINGFNFKDRELIDRMNKATRHRGPDGTGVFLDDRMSLGHALLAITETPELSQGPSISDDGNAVLVYNGEIYNYRTLREELIREGESFLTDGDTEVLLKGLRRHGIEFVHRLDGMFAFGFYDVQSMVLYVARDKAGMKPVYFNFHNGRFVFSSEIRGLLCSMDARLNYDALGIFFTLGYVPGHRSLFKGIEKVRPGHYVRLDLEKNKLTDHRFAENVPADAIEFDPERFRSIIGSSVLEHTMGRRPYGVYLSGGLDSTIILHELAQQKSDAIKTYTTRFDVDDKRFNEDADMAHRLCGEYSIEHHEVMVTERDFINSFEDTINVMEEPRYHISAPAYYLLAQRASKDVVVVLSGNGGDELFMGYDRYFTSRLLTKRYEKFPAFFLDFANTMLQIRRGNLRPVHFLRLSNLLVRWAFLNKIRLTAGGPELKISRFDVADLASLLADDAGDILQDQPCSDSENAIAALDRRFWLADEEFIRADKIIMHFGMEGRFPFLADRVVRYANAIPSSQKLRGGSTKALVREAYRGILPSYIVDKPKTGWYAPTVLWLKSDLGQHIRAALDPAFYAPTSELFDLEYIRTKHFDGVKQFTRVNIKNFMPVAIFQYWARSFGVIL